MQTITMLNPLSSQYHALEDFKTLKTSQKIITIALTIIAALATVLIGTAAVFRLLVNHYVRKVDVDKSTGSVPCSEDAAEKARHKIPSGKSPVNLVPVASQNETQFSMNAGKETNSVRPLTEDEQFASFGTAFKTPKSLSSSVASEVGGTRKIAVDNNSVLKSSTLDELNSLAAMLDKVRASEPASASDKESAHHLDDSSSTVESTDDTDESIESAALSKLRRYIIWLNELEESDLSTVSDDERTQQLEDLSNSSETFVETSESASLLPSANEEIETFESSESSDLKESGAKITVRANSLVSETKDIAAADTRDDRLDDLNFEELSYTDMEEEAPLEIPSELSVEISPVSAGIASNVPILTSAHSKDQVIATKVQKASQSASSKIDSKNKDDQAAVSRSSSGEETQDGIDPNISFENEQSDVERLYSLQKRTSLSFILANSTGSQNNILTSGSVNNAVLSSVNAETQAEPFKEHLIERKEADRIRVMAALASNLANEIQDNDDKQRSPLPSPANLGIEIPKGIYAQAYRSGNEVIVAIRCPEVTPSRIKDVQDAVAELQISPHQSEDDLNQSIAKVNSYLRQMHGYELQTDLLSLIITTNSTKVLSADESPGYEIIAGAGQGAKVGGAVASALGTAAATGLVVAGVAAAPVAAFIAGACALTGIAGGAATGLVKEGVKKTVNALKKKGSETTLPTLQTALKALDSYLLALKQNDISQSDAVVTTGEAMAGVLSALVGAIHSREAYCFNSEEILSESERGVILENCGLKRQAAGYVGYKNISLNSELIGKPLQLQPNHKTLYLDIGNMGIKQSIPVVLLEKHSGSFIAAH